MAVSITAERTAPALYFYSPSGMEETARPGAEVRVEFAPGAQDSALALLDSLVAQVRADVEASR